MRHARQRIGLWSGLCLALSLVSWPERAEARRIVVIVMDDAGVDLFGAYGEVRDGMAAPDEHLVTPRIDQLAEQGLLFRNAWSAPLCSATRATLMTGRYGYRTGVGGPVPVLDVTENPEDGEQTFPQLLSASHPARVAIGKWHLTQYVPDAPPFHSTGITPITAGFSEYRGAWNNLDRPVTPPDSFFLWRRAEEIAPSRPTVVWENTYATRYEVQKAIDFVGSSQAVGADWLLWVGLHALHSPLQVPPDDLHGDEGLKALYDEGAAPVLGDELRVRKAVLQAMDHEIGRLVDALDLETTTVILLGDNGSALPLLTARNREGKGTIYEGGINVPLIVAGEALGAAAEGMETAALVHTVDVFSSILELAEVAPPEGVAIDGVSFVPVLGDPAVSPRSVVYADGVFGGQDGSTSDRRNHHVAVRDGRYKLIRFGCQEGFSYNRHEFYDLQSDPLESTPLPLNGASYNLLANLIPRSACEPQPPCGFGFEIALVVPLLARLPRQRRRA